MIYNLSKYVSNNSSIVPITNGYDLNKEDGSVALILTGGEQKGPIGNRTYQVQCLTSSQSRVEAEMLCRTVFELLSNRYKLTLPEVTVESTTFSEVVADVILAIQTPGYIGADEDGNHQWSVNFNITTGG